MGCRVMWSQCSTHPFVGNRWGKGHPALLLACAHSPITSTSCCTPTFPGNAAAPTELPHPVGHHGHTGWPGAAGQYLVLKPLVPGRSLEREARRCRPGDGFRMGSSASGDHLQPELSGSGWGPPPDGPSMSPEEGLAQPRLEGEIDLLAQELARQEAGRWRLTALPQPEAPHRLLETAATLGLSDRGQGPGLGLPSTQGAPAPTTHTSLGSPVSPGPVHMSPLDHRGGRGGGFSLVLIVACSVAGAAALAVAALCWCRLQRDIRLTQKADYAAAQAPGSPATPPKISPGDQRLARSAEVYHYQHRRQQMRCLERHKEPPKELDSASSDEENEDGDFTVYECPGLAPTGEMEVRNPLFDHSSLSAPLPPPPQ